MWHYIKEHIKPFWIGFTGSGVVWGGVLFADANPGSWPPLAFILKLVGAAAIAFASGLATSLSTDFYKEFKSRLKKYQDGKQKKDDENHRAA